MPPDITGPGAAGGVPIPPSAPVRPATPSRALVPVERTGPRAPGDSPLGRSGVALGDLLFSPDLLETREAVAPVAMELGLETARRQLLQRMAAESLVSLDAVWARAVGSEEGWYLRAGALTVLGHPTEGDKVAGEGLETQPQSLALRLLQSVSRALVGDLSGARAALYPALDQAPDDPVLLAQQAVVLAKQGHADDAADLLQRLSTEAPDHPALLWARTAVRVATADRTRSSARPVSSPESGGPASRASAPLGEPSVDAVAGAEVDGVDGDMVSSAFRRLGAQIRTLGDDALVHEARTLLRACSAGGTLGSASTPLEAHAARQVLSALLTAMRGDAIVDVLADATLLRAQTPLMPLVQQILPLLRSERGRESDTMAADADRLLRRQGNAVPPEVRHLVELLIDGADGAGREARARRISSDGPEITQGSDDPELGPLIPVRLGLSLLGETSATRAIERRQELVDARALAMGAGAPVADGAVFEASDATLISPRITAEHAGTGWGAAKAVADQQPGAPAAGVGAAIPVILLVAAAVGAAMNGAAVVAAVLGAAGLWLALRSRGLPP